MQERRKNKNAAKNIRIGFTGLEFSRRILNKYAFIRKSGMLPSLIFLKLFSNKIESGKLRPYPKSKSIINYYRFHFSLYFGMVRKSMSVSGTSPMEHVSFIIEFIEPHLQSSEKGLKRISNSVKQIVSKKYHTGSFEQDKILVFLNIRGKSANTGYNFISMPEIVQPYGSKSDSFKISGQSGNSIRSQYVQTISQWKQLNSNIFPEFIYLNVFHQMMLQMHHELGKNYGKLLPIRNKGTREINYSYAQTSKRRDNSYHISYLMAGPAKIALSPAASGYLQRARYPEKAGSMRYNVTSPEVFRKIKDLDISGSMGGSSKVYLAMESSEARMDNVSMNQDVIARNVRYKHAPDWHISSYYFSYLTAGRAKIILSPADSVYLQKDRWFEKTGSMRYNATSPAVFKKLNKEPHVSGSLRGQSKVYSAMESSDAAKKDNLSMNQHGITREIRYERPDRIDSSYYFSYLMSGPARIALSPAASGYLHKDRWFDKTGSMRYNATSPAVFRKINKEPYVSGSLRGQSKVYSAMESSDAAKKDNLSMNQDGIGREIRYERPDRIDSSYYFSYLMSGPAKIALIPATSEYLQKDRCFGKTGPIRLNVTPPEVFRKINKEFSISGSSGGTSKVYFATESPAAGKKDNLSMNLDMITPNVRYEHAPDRHDGSDYFSYLMAGHVKISHAISRYLQRKRRLENAGSIRYNAASPAVFQKMNMGFGSSGSASHQSQIISIVRKNEYRNLNFREYAGNNAYNPSELVIKKIPLQGTENLTRNSEEKTMSANSIDQSVKDPVRPINEINRIADRVYHIIERKISIEKDRRGLL